MSIQPGSHSPRSPLASSPLLWLQMRVTRPRSRRIVPRQQFRLSRHKAWAVPLWGRFEVRLTRDGSAPENALRDPILKATFTSPTGRRVEFIGFYDGRPCSRAGQRTRVRRRGPGVHRASPAIIPIARAFRKPSAPPGRPIHPWLQCVVRPVPRRPAQRRPSRPCRSSGGGRTGAWLRGGGRCGHRARSLLS